MKAGKTAALITGAVTLSAVVFIMVNGLGLNPDLDFGAGAYYYADIPDFEKTLDWDCYQASLPLWVYVLLFVVWGVVMYCVWKYIDGLHSHRR